MYVSGTLDRDGSISTVVVKGVALIFVDQFPACNETCVFTKLRILVRTMVIDLHDFNRKRTII